MLGIVLLLTGCAGVNLNLEWFNSDEEVNPPRELVEISAEIRLDRLWSVDVGNGQGDNYTEITPAIAGRVFLQQAKMAPCWPSILIRGTCCGAAG